MPLAIGDTVQIGNVPGHGTISKILCYADASDGIRSIYALAPDEVLYSVSVCGCELLFRAASLHAVPRQAA